MLFKKIPPGGKCQTRSSNSRVTLRDTLSAILYIYITSIIDNFSNLEQKIIIINFYTSKH
jgi:hypothetical protein